MDDIQSWWEVPSIAHFCSLFRVAFNLLDFGIEELEEALITDGVEDGPSLIQELVVRLLKGCLPDQAVAASNFQMYLRRIFRNKAQECGYKNPFDSDIDFQFVALRTKVEILHALCDFRLDAEDVQEQLKNLEAESLRVLPLGHDDNKSTYWYFYGTRLYREDYIVAPEPVNVGKGRRKRKLIEAPTTPISKWQVVCFTHQDWEDLCDKLKDSNAKVEEALYQTLTEDFLPEIPRLFAEKEKLLRKREETTQVRRQSSRIEKLKERRHEDEERRKVEEEFRETEMKKEKEEDEKLREEERKYQSLLNSRNNRYERRALSVTNSDVGSVVSGCGASRESLDSFENNQNISINPSSTGSTNQNQTSTAVVVGRQTNNSLACATGPIIIKNATAAEKKKIRGSQVFAQTSEDIQTGMFKVLENVKNHSEAWPFLGKVEEEYAPGYYRVVRNPMDLEIMEEKLETQQYLSPQAFRRDFELIVQNCKEYNGKDNEYTQMVEELQKVFDRLWNRFLNVDNSSDEDVNVDYSTLLYHQGCRKRRGSGNRSTITSGNHTDKKAKVEKDDAHDQSEVDQSEAENSVLSPSSPSVESITSSAPPTPPPSNKTRKARIARTEKENEDNSRIIRRTEKENEDNSRSSRRTEKENEDNSRSSRRTEKENEDNRSNRRTMEKERKRRENVKGQKKDNGLYKKSTESSIRTVKSKKIELESEDDMSDNEIIKTKKEVKKNKPKPQGVLRNTAAIEALELATEQTLKDINKWLDDTPRFSEYSSASNSPCAPPVLYDEYDIEEEYRRSLRMDRIEMNNRSRINSRRSSPDKRFRLHQDGRRKEYQHNIHRLQPGKMKGNLLTGGGLKGVGKEETMEGGGNGQRPIKEVKNALLVVPNNSGPKLSLGSVLNSDICSGLGRKYTFGEGETSPLISPSPPSKTPSPTIQQGTSKERNKGNIMKYEEPSEPVTESSVPLPNKSPEVIANTVLIEPKSDTSKPTEVVKPNLSAWLRAFGAPKGGGSTTPVKKSTVSVFAQPPCTPRPAPPTPKPSPPKVEKKIEETKSRPPSPVLVVTPPLQPNNSSTRTTEGRVTPSWYQEAPLTSNVVSTVDSRHRHMSDACSSVASEQSSPFSQADPESEHSPYRQAEEERALTETEGGSPGRVLGGGYSAPVTVGFYQDLTQHSSPEKTPGRASDSSPGEFTPPIYSSRLYPNMMPGSVESPQYTQQPLSPATSIGHSPISHSPGIHPMHSPIPQHSPVNPMQQHSPVNPMQHSPVNHTMQHSPINPMQQHTPINHPMLNSAINTLHQSSVPSIHHARVNPMHRAQVNPIQHSSMLSNQSQKATSMLHPPSIPLSYGQSLGPSAAMLHSPANLAPPQQTNPSLAMHSVPPLHPSTSLSLATHSNYDPTRSLTDQYKAAAALDTRPDDRIFPVKKRQQTRNDEALTLPTSYYPTPGAIGLPGTLSGLSQMVARLPDESPSSVPVSSSLAWGFQQYDTNPGYNQAATTYPQLYSPHDLSKARGTYPPAGYIMTGDKIDSSYPCQFAHHPQAYRPFDMSTLYPTQPPYYQPQPMMIHPNPYTTYPPLLPSSRQTPHYDHNNPRPSWL